MTNMAVRPGCPPSSTMKSSLISGEKMAEQNATYLGDRSS